MEHLLNHYPFSCLFWDNATQIFRQSDRRKDNLIDTIAYQINVDFHNPILNHLW
jgi:hypothetical protein